MDNSNNSSNNSSSCYHHETPYPAQTKKVSGEVSGVSTEVMTISFGDRILVSIVQEGRLAQWVCIYVCMYVCMLPTIQKKKKKEREEKGRGGFLVYIIYCLTGGEGGGS